MPDGPGPDQRRRDTRLAWIIVGCSAVATLVVLVVGLWALSGPIGRGMEAMVASNRSAPAAGRDPDVGKATSATGDNAADPAPADEVQKRSADGQDDGDDGASVRRGAGPRERDEAPPARRSGPIA